MQPQNLVGVVLAWLKPSNHIFRANYPLASTSNTLALLAFQSFLVFEGVGDK